MKTAGPKIYQFFGWNVQGDIGPYTMYTKSNNALTLFLKAPPKMPASPYQLYYRARWATAARDWSAMDQTFRDIWNAAAKRTHLRVNGLNLWMYWRLRQDRACIRTIERQSGLTLIPPGP